MNPPALEPCVSARDVMAALGCSRSAAYEHLRRASGRGEGTRGLLRVRQSVWNTYQNGWLSRGGAFDHRADQVEAVLWDVLELEVGS